MKTDSGLLAFAMQRVLAAEFAELLEFDFLLRGLLVLVGDVDRTAFLPVSAKKLNRFAHERPRGTIVRDIGYRKPVGPDKGLKPSLWKKQHP